jgi:hypothetical protein
MRMMRNLGKLSACLMLALLISFLMSAAACAQQAAAPAQDVLQAYDEVLSGARAYLQCDTLENTVTEATMQHDINLWYGMIFEVPLHYAAYAVTDLDQDGSPEVLLQLTDDFGYELLRYQEEAVYGYPFVARAMEGVTAEGDIHGSNGADNYGWYRLRFNGPVMDTTVVCWRYDEQDPPARYMIGDREVPQAEFEACNDDLWTRNGLFWTDLELDNPRLTVTGE